FRKRGLDISGTHARVRIAERDDVVVARLHGESAHGAIRVGIPRRRSTHRDARDAVDFEDPVGDAQLCAHALPHRRCNDNLDLDTATFGTGMTYQQRTLSEVERLVDDQPSGAYLPDGFENERSSVVPARDRARSRGHWTDGERTTAITIEQREEHRRRVDPRPAEPRNVTV